MLERPSRERVTKRGRRSPLPRIGLLVLLGALGFVLGIAFDRTLHDRPQPGETVTTVRTLEPIPQEAPGRTVTVTVTAARP